MVTLDEIRDKTSEVVKEIKKAVIGYDKEIEIIIATLYAGGHALLEGVPGIAKTTLARALVRVLGLSEKERVSIDGIPYRGLSRIQFTPDLMPSDITGSLVFNPLTKEFEPRLGPIFSYIVLADEINRATPRTQSAMLQAMQEKEVTIGEKTFPLENRALGKFFYVIATENPIEMEGTYPLPEAQLDRFMVRVVMDYPSSLEEEKEIYKLHAYRLGEPVEELERIVSPKWVIETQDFITRNTRVSEAMLDYIARIMRATRPDVFKGVRRFFELGASPRAGIMLIKLSKALATIRGSSVVEARDVERALFYVLNHRLIPNVDLVIEYGGDFRAKMKVISEGLKYVVEAVT